MPEGAGQEPRRTGAAQGDQRGRLGPALSWALRPQEPPPGSCHQAPRAANFTHNTSHAGRCCGLTRQRGLGRRALVHKHFLVLPVSGGHKLVPLPRRGALPGRRPRAKVRATEGDGRSPRPPAGPAPCVRRVPRHLDRGRSLGASFLLPEIPPAHVSGHNILGAEGSRFTGGPHRGSWEPRARLPPAWRIQGLRAGPCAPLQGMPTEEARKPPALPRDQPGDHRPCGPLFSPDGLCLLCRGGPAPPHDGRLPCRGWAWQPTEPAPLLSPSGS